MPHNKSASFNNVFSYATMMFSSWIIWTTLVAIVIGTPTSQGIDLMSVARCRSQCIELTLPLTQRPPDGLNDGLCKTNSECLICWEHCFNLFQDWNKWNTVCNMQLNFCPQHLGCQHACTAAKYLTVPNTAHSEPNMTFPPTELVYFPGEQKLQVNWQNASLQMSLIFPKDVFVYWIFFLTKEDSWASLTQTLNNTLEFRLDGDPTSYGFKILAVNRNGGVSETPILYYTAGFTKSTESPPSNRKIDFKNVVNPKASNDAIDKSWKNVVDNINAIKEKLSNSSLMIQQLDNAAASATQLNGNAPLLMYIIVPVTVIPLVLGLIILLIYTQRSHRQQLTEMRTAIHSWSAKIGSSFRNSLHTARRSLRRTGPNGTMKSKASSQFSSESGCGQRELFCTEVLLPDSTTPSIRPEEV